MHGGGDWVEEPVFLLSEQFDVHREEISSSRPHRILYILAGVPPVISPETIYSFTDTKLRYNIIKMIIIISFNYIAQIPYTKPKIFRKKNLFFCFHNINQ